MAGGADLPSMVDALPTFDEDYGSEGQGTSDNDGAENKAEGDDGSGRGDQVAQSTDGGAGTGSEGDDPGGADGDAGTQNSPGTRASGGMESDMGANGPLTSAERVAILDRQLEESTRDFDGIIYDEEQRQREATRERAAQTAQDSEVLAEEILSDVGFEETTPPPSAVEANAEQNSAKEKPPQIASVAIPKDLQNVQDDPRDIFARELREAAMREPDPELREKLWSEYRAWKGIKEPDV